jgi:hypothetical protein
VSAPLSALNEKGWVSNGLRPSLFGKKRLAQIQHDRIGNALFAKLMERYARHHGNQEINAVDATFGRAILETTGIIAQARRGRLDAQRFHKARNEARRAISIRVKIPDKWLLRIPNVNKHGYPVTAVLEVGIQIEDEAQHPHTPLIFFLYVQIANFGIEALQGGRVMLSRIGVGGAKINGKNAHKVKPRMGRLILFQNGANLLIVQPRVGLGAPRIRIAWAQIRRTERTPLFVRQRRCTVHQTMLRTLRTTLYLLFQPFGHLRRQTPFPFPCATLDRRMAAAYFVYTQLFTPTGGLHPLFNLHKIRDEQMAGEYNMTYSNMILSLVVQFFLVACIVLFLLIGPEPRTSLVPNSLLRVLRS